MEVSGDEGSARSQRRTQREERRQAAQQQAQEDSASDSDADLDLLRSMSGMKLSEDAPPVYLGTGYVYDELFARHKCEWDENYPENPQRVLQPVARCQQLGLVERCVPIPIRYATEDQIQWQHTLRHLEIVKSTVTMNKEQLMKLAAQYHCWFCNQATFESSLAAAGSAIELMDQILQKKVTNGFAMVRPPGHHAMQEEFCGYCTFNNVALAATHALSMGVERVLIVDWDVHHGQATQYMFYDDPRVVYFSIHRYEYGTFWPNLRESDYDFIGEGKGKGYNVNIPLNKTGMRDADYFAIFYNILLPLAYEFSPDVIIISSGYDAAIGCPEFRPQVILVSCGLDSAIGDEKGEMLVSPAAYAHFIHMLSPICEGRICTVLEGGYCLQSLAEGCALTLRSLLGDPCPLLPPLGEPSDSMVTTILNVVKVLRPYWNCFQLFDYTARGEACPFEEVKIMPPREGVEFSTPENSPDENDIMGNYPTQSEETISYFAQEINRLIAETSLAKAPNRTCFVFDADMRKHRNTSDSTHPERPKRISAIFEKHREWGLLKRCLQLESRMATEDEILLVHKQHYLEDIKVTAEMDEEQLSARPREMKYNSIYICKDTYESARLSAGCVLQTVDVVMSGQAQSGVAVVRPPGHHAECHTAMGFCFFNNVAIAAVYAQKKYNVKRVLILDWDVHHGNATQHMFYADPSVLYISLHRFENGFFFPGSPEAGAQFVGQGEAKGCNVNIPWNRERMGNAEYMSAFQKIVMPIAYEYAPELVIVSAGFDAAQGDFLGGYKVTPECYGHLTHMLSGLANGRVILALEGGYNTEAISLSMATCTSVLLGDPCPPWFCENIKDSAVDTIRYVLNIQKDYWRSLKTAVKVPVPQTSSEESAEESAGLQGPGSEVREGEDTYEQRVGVNPGTSAQVLPVGNRGDLSNNRPLQTKDSAGPSNPPGPTTQTPEENPTTSVPPGTSYDATLAGVTSGTERMKLTSDSGDGLDVGRVQVKDEVTEGQGQGQSANVQVAMADSAGQNVKKEETKTGPSPGQSSVETQQSGPSTSAEEGGEELLGACGGSNRPNTVEDVLRMQGVEQLYAVQPAPWCPHLTCVQPLPPGGLDTTAPCEDCGDVSENWVCLVCYKVFCSRYVQEHMLFHSVANEGHLMVLSYSDLSVWCYACNDYIDNEITYPMKDAAHRSKFGEGIPNYYSL